MSFKSLMRTKIRNILTGEDKLVLKSQIPLVENKFDDFEYIGFYLRIPFCRQICPYCPYNKMIYQPEIAEEYTKAVLYEIDLYAKMISNKPVNSFYIGGGTPTTILNSGLDIILEHVFNTFNMQCGIYLESHPNDLTKDNLNTLSSLGVEYLSTGVEAFQDHQLRLLQRSYTGVEVKSALERAVNNGLKYVNADIIFNLPGQSVKDIIETANILINIGVDQISTYPLFEFSHTGWFQHKNRISFKKPSFGERRQMLSNFENIFYSAGYSRSTVWSFTKVGVPKYCAVTVPHYIGLGTSSSSYLNDVFYINTFNIYEYIEVLKRGKLPIALSLELSERLQMSSWFYWKLYETTINKREFFLRFGKEFNKVFGGYIWPLLLAGFITENGEEISLTDKGIFWLHALFGLFSIDYIGDLWESFITEPWPDEIVI